MGLFTLCLPVPTAYTANSDGEYSNDERESGDYCDRAVEYYVAITLQMDCEAILATTTIYHHHFEYRLIY